MAILGRSALAASAAITIAIGALAGVASASTGGRVGSPEQAGYSATGAQLKTVQTKVYLRQPGQYAGEVSSYRLSVQLWSAKWVLSMGVYASTSPASAYRPVAAVYNRTTHALVCNTTTAGDLCPGTPANWADGSLTYPAGDSVYLLATYTKTTGGIRFAVIDPVMTPPSTGFKYPLGTGISFSQARVGAELGATPWSTATYSPPQAATRLALFPASYLTTYNNVTSGFQSWWRHHKVIMTDSGGATEVAPSDLSRGGTYFGVDLQPQS